MYLFMVTLNKQSKQITGMENSIIQLTVSFLTVGVFGGFRHSLVIYVPGEACVWILILGIVNTGIGCYLYFSPLAKLPVQTVVICGYVYQDDIFDTKPERKKARKLLDFRAFSLFEVSRD